MGWSSSTDDFPSEVCPEVVAEIRAAVPGLVAAMRARGVPDAEVRRRLVRGVRDSLHRYTMMTDLGRETVMETYQRAIDEALGVA